MRCFYETAKDEAIKDQYGLMKQHTKTVVGGTILGVGVGSGVGVGIGFALLAAGIMMTPLGWGLAAGLGLFLFGLGGFSLVNFLLRRQKRLAVVRSVEPESSE